MGGRLRIQIVTPTFKSGMRVKRNTRVKKKALRSLLLANWNLTLVAHAMCTAH